MAETETEQINKAGNQAEISFDPKDNHFVFTVVLVDMDDAVRDVIGVLHLCAPDPNQALQRAGFLFSKQGLTKPNGKYSLLVGVIAPLPDSQPRVIRPRLEIPKSLIKGV